MLVPIVAVLLQSPVVVPSQAMRLDAFLKAFSASSHQTMHASKTMAGRIVIVAGPAQTPDGLRSDLASATWGKWRRVGDEYFLDEDLEAIRQRDRTRLAAKIGAIKREQAAEGARAGGPFSIEAAKALRTKLEAMDQSRRRNDSAYFKAWSGVKDGTPSMSALRRVFAGMDPEQLARQTEGTVVYSDRPTRLQRPLSPSSKNAIRQLERDQTVWAGVNTDDQSWRDGNGPVYTMDPRNYADSMGQGSLRLVLRCESQAGGNGFYLTAWFVDKELKLRQFAEMNFGFGNAQLDGEAPPKEDPAEAPLKLPPETIVAIKGLAGGDTRPFRAKLIAPERYEPMELLAGEPLRATANARNKPLVAWLPDDAANLVVSCRRQLEDSRGLTPSRVLTNCYAYGLSVTETAGHILIRPRDAAINVSRTTLGGVVRAVDQRGFAPLDELADYAAETRATWMDPLLELWIDGLQPSASQLASTDWSTLRLWSVFSRPQRATFLKQGTVAWRELTGPQRDAVTEAIVNADRNEIRRVGPGGSGLGLTEEPTEILANGFAVNTDVHGDGSISDAIYGRDTEKGYGRMLGPWQLAYAVAAREKTGGPEPRDGFGRDLPEAFSVGRQVTFGISMTIGPNLTWLKRGMIGEIDLRQSPKPMDNLPSSFLTQFRSALEQARKQPGNE